jgi:hypothetical protein
MKVVIAGGRDFNHIDYFNGYMSTLPDWIELTEIVSGGARGVDALGEGFATANNIKLTIFPADWEKYGPKAGPIRNNHMAKYCDGVIAFWDGKSRGTENMINTAHKYMKWTYIVRYDVKWDRRDHLKPNNVFITKPVENDLW